MSFPALENGPYIFNTNIDCVGVDGADKSKRMLFELKEALVALGGAGTIWTSIASCDGVSVLNIDPEEPIQDLWLDKDDVIYGATHAWCILENSTTGGQLLIDRTNLDNKLNCKYSPGGLFTNDGTTTVAPTATDAATLVSSAINFHNQAYIGCVLHVMCSADHKTTRFYFYERGLASYNVGGWMGLIEEVVDTPSQWISTFKTMILYHNITPVWNYIPFQQSPYLDHLDGMNWNVYLETSEPYAGWIATRCAAFCYGSLGTTQGSIITFINDSLGVQGGYPVSPIWLYSDNSGIHGGWYGRLRDIYFGQYIHKSLTTYPGDGSKDWIKFGALVVPWDGSRPSAVDF